MKKIQRLIVFIAITCILAGLTGCNFISKTPEGEKKTAVAKVNGEKITKEDLDKKIAPQLAQMEMQYGKDFLKSKEAQDYVTQMKQGALENMIQEKVMLQKAKELNVASDEKALNAEVDKEIKDITKVFGDEAKLKEKLTELKLTVDDYKEVVKNQLIMKKLYENITKDVKVTENDERTYYFNNIYNYTVKPNTLNVSHILVKTEEDAKKVQGELAKGAKFDALAKKYSIDPGSKDKGGNLGDINYNDTNYDKTFLTAAIMQPIGKVSNPVKTQFGIHLIKVNNKHEYAKKPFESVKAEINKTLTDEKKAEKFKAALKEWQSKATIKKY